MTPDALIDSPGGKPLANQLYGVVPAATVTGVFGYAVPAVHVGNDAGPVIDGVALMTIV